MTFSFVCGGGGLLMEEDQQNVDVSKFRKVSRKVERGARLCFAGGTQKMLVLWVEIRVRARKKRLTARHPNFLQGSPFESCRDQGSRQREGDVAVADVAVGKRTSVGERRGRGGGARRDRRVEEGREWVEGLEGDEK